jgi:BlaI family transcriptional regulator, penicillinase repressor
MERATQATEPNLSRREREIMDVLYARGRATGLEIRDSLGGNPGYSTVRTILRILERKGHVRHEEDGQRYVYAPTVARDAARSSALRRLIRTFFDGSAKAAAAALIDPKSSELSPADLKELETMIRAARKERT